MAMKADDLIFLVKRRYLPYLTVQSGGEQPFRSISHIPSISLQLLTSTLQGFYWG